MSAHTLFRPLSFRLRCGLAACFLSVGPLVAQAATADGGRDYAAERSTLDAARQWAEYRYREAEHGCYNKFFMNACINKADDARREALQDIRRREIAVNDAERASKAATRDREAAIRKAEFEAERGKRDAEERRNRSSYEGKQRAHTLREAEREASAPQREANAAEHARKQAEFDARIREAHEEGARKAQERADNVTAFEQKQREAEERRRQLEERREKAKDRAGKAQSTNPLGN